MTGVGESDRSGPRRGKRPASGEPVIDRALRLLGAFDAGHRRLTISELARRSSIPLSSAHRLAERLAAWGAIERDDDGRYAIGLRLYEVASLAPRGQGLREIAAPFVEDLFVVTRHHVQLAVREGSAAVMIDRRSGPGAVSVDYRTGGKLPLLATALGQVLLATLPRDELDAVLQACDHPDDVYLRERRDLVDAPLATVRREGLAHVRRERPAPLIAVATPIRDRSDAVQAALSIVVPAGTPTQSLEPALRTAARGISRALRES